LHPDRMAPPEPRTGTHPVRSMCSNSIGRLDRAELRVPHCKTSDCRRAEFLRNKQPLTPKTDKMARTRKRTIRPSDNLRRRTGRRSGLSTEKSAGDHFALHNEPIEIYTGSNRLILLPIARDRT
jgi:hypothetical protein